MLITMPGTQWALFDSDSWEMPTILSASALYPDLEPSRHGLRTGPPSLGQAHAEAGVSEVFLSNSPTLVHSLALVLWSSTFN